MKISCNWLKQYVNINLPAEEVAKLLTNCGLEVESIEKFETCLLSGTAVKGGLEGCVIGEVKTKTKHPDADKLCLTTVDTGTGTLLNIVCGASNVAVGQKVVVANIGATIYPASGAPVTLKEAKIRGAVSEGMICAEDELGLGSSHEGIMVLDAAAKVGTPAKEYFQIETDYIFEIGLTPNRADAASHVGVARDLAAVLICQLNLPSAADFKTDSDSLKIEVAINDTIACPRYSGITIRGVSVTTSPHWLKLRLQSIGIRPINNIVDVTNFVLHELGQPLHAFDADKISGGKIIVKKLPAGTKFQTLDGVERTLTANDLMICDSQKPMCMAGVFGGMESGVAEKTKNIFIESAYFDAVHIRKTAKHHALKTDASFRYERGADPNITVHALKRAAMLIKEIAGGEIASEIIDNYPKPIENFKVPLSYANCDKLIGKKIEREKIKSILISLGMEIVSEGTDALLLSVPPFKVDVQREADVVEEILRIYGYNNVEISSQVHSSLPYSTQPDAEKIQNIISDLLSANGFNEIICNSLSNANYYSNEESLKAVSILNPMSVDLNVLRMTMLFSGLETIVYNQNRKNADLKFYEFGKTYMKSGAGSLPTGQAGSVRQIGPRYSGSFSGELGVKNILEKCHLSLFLCGRKEEENWDTSKENMNFYSLKGNVNAVASRLGIAYTKSILFSNDFIAEGMEYFVQKKSIAVFGEIKKSVLKKFDIKGDIHYADFNWDAVLDLVKNNSVRYKEVPKFPEVRRDLAMLIDKSVNYQQLEELAFSAEKVLLKRVNLFDVYEGDKIESGKKSYAMSFILQDENATLTDKQIDSVMQKLQKTFEEKAEAKIRAN